MIDRFKLGLAELNRFRCGPLGPHLDGFARLLSEQGYSSQVGMQKIRLVAFLSRWLEERHIAVQKLDEQRVADFLKSRKQPLRRHRQVQHTLTQLLQHFRRSKIIPDQRPPQFESPTDLLMHGYSRFLSQERALGQVTLGDYLPVARRFLSTLFGTKAVHLNQLAASDVNGFVLRDKSTFSPKRVQLTTSALRSFLGFLYLRGQRSGELPA